ncbi:unnamed protein product [Rotaria sp. Silwood2]|nr:unnamed protein product [Rotaria sp. Silwood2]
MKRVGCKILEGVAYGAAQGAVDHIVTNYMNGVCDAIQQTITSDLDVIFQTHQLNEVVSEAYKTLGEEQASLLMNHVTRECFEGQSILQTMYSWCKRIYGAVSRGIGEAMRKIGKADSAKSIQTVLLVLKSLQIVSLIEGVMTEIVKVKVSAKEFLNKATKIIQEAIDEKTSSTTTTCISAPTNVKILCERSAQQWKELLIQTSNQAIANQIVAPLLSFGANQLISLAGNAIKKKYRSMKEEKYQKQFDSLKKEFDDKTKNEQMSANEYEEELQAYHDNLMKLLAKTRSPKMFANILRENVPMDMICAQACTFVLHKYMSEMNITNDGKKFTGIHITVQGQDGSSHEYSSASNPSHSITIQLDGNHFVIGGQDNGNIDTSKNNCLYQALVSKYPGLKEAFADGAAFRHHLSNYIETDKYMSYTISQGWHKFSITKSSYGGAIKEEKFNQENIYNKILENTEEAKEKLIKKYGHLPGRVREKFQNCVEAIKKIVQEEGQSDDAIQRINKITENFSTYLTKEASGDHHRDLREDFKKLMTDFGIRVGQNLTTEYTQNLQNFLEKAQHADLPRSSFVAMHPADRVDFTQDDIKLEKLVGKGMKISENPDIIASVIHGELNKTLSEDDRRYNTVAVGIHKKTLYIAMNQIEQQGNNQIYGISDERCGQIRDILMAKNLLSGREEIIFITTNATPRNQAECRGPHAEMQILKYWKDNEILQDNQNINSNKPSRIGASKPACLCCSTAMISDNILHKIYAKANTNPVNWKDTKMVNVRVQHRLRIRNFNV